MTTKNHLESLWAPWRVEYFEQKDHNPDFLLEAAQTQEDEKHLVLLRNKSSFLMMNRYPYAVGHLMIVPYRKIEALSLLTPQEWEEFWKLLVHGEALLKKVLHPSGFNIGINQGSAAGAGAADHLHLHLVPRWENDQNFMPILGQTRIIPQALFPLYEQLKRESLALLKDDFSQEYQ